MSKEVLGEAEVPRKEDEFLLVLGVSFPIIHLCMALLWSLLKPWGLTPKAFLKYFYGAGGHYFLGKTGWFTEYAQGWGTVGWWPGIAWIFVAMGVVSLGLAFGIALILTNPPAKTRHVSGKRFIQHPVKAAKKATQALALEYKLSSPGLYIHPDVQISRERETRHFLVVGSSGGGKTTVIGPLLEDVQARRDKVIIYDNKCEFTAKFKGLIFAPWDKRCVGWAVGQDIVNRADAEALAARLIEEPESGGDPMWANGARLIFVALIVKEQQENPYKWNFEDILKNFIVPDSVIMETVKRFNPLGYRLVADLKFKATQSFLIQIAAFMAPVQAMAQGWRGRPQFSFRKWLVEDGYSNKEFPSNTVILQGSKRYKETSKAYMQSLFALFQGIINSADLGESKERRIWLFLDEVPQLGKVQEIEDFLSVGRSKGVCLVLGLQVKSQLEKEYSSEEAQTWFSMMKTMIICQTFGEKTPDELEKLIGKRKIERLNVTYSTGQDNKPKMSYNYVLDEEPVVSADFIKSDELGGWSHPLFPRRKGVRSILHANTNCVYRLLWPFWDRPAFRPGQVQREDDFDFIKDLRIALEALEENNGSSLSNELAAEARISEPISVSDVNEEPEQPRNEEAGVVDVEDLLSGLPPLKCGGKK